jgi:hypothetical protein
MNPWNNPLLVKVYKNRISRDAVSNKSGGIAD